MYVFLWRAVKYFLWLCLFVLLGAFLFWLIRFKWDFKEYVLYLNNVWIEEIVSLEEEEKVIAEEIEDNFETIVLEEENSDLLEDDYFLPEASPFWFSGSLENDEPLNNEADKSSISKENLLDLIKSHEK